MCILDGEGEGGVSINPVCNFRGAKERRRRGSWKKWYRKCSPHLLTEY